MGTRENCPPTSTQWESPADADPAVDASAAVAVAESPSAAFGAETEAREPVLALAMECSGSWIRCRCYP